MKAPIYFPKEPTLINVSKIYCVSTSRLIPVESIRARKPTVTRTLFNKNEKAMNSKYLVIGISKIMLSALYLIMKTS